VGWGLKIAGETTQKGKDEDRKEAKEPDDNSESKGPTWSSKYGFNVHQHANRVGLYRGKNNPNDPELMTELDELDAGTEYADSDPF
jgi:hypothetical protein